MKKRTSISSSKEVILTLTDGAKPTLVFDNKGSATSSLVSSSSSTTFALPSGWSTDRSGTQNTYYSPDGKRFFSLSDVERYVNAVPSSSASNTKSSSSSSFSSSTNVVPNDDAPQVHKKSERIKRFAGSGKKTGHSQRHATFTLPRGWTKEVDKHKRNYYISPNGDVRLKGLPNVERYMNAGPCPKCTKESGKREGHSGRHNGPCLICVANSGRISGHKGPHATFALPEDWMIDDSGSKKSYVSPEGKRFYGLPNVERFLAGSGHLDNHYGRHATFVLPRGWKKEVKKNINYYISPDNSVRLQGLPNVERYMNAGPCPDCIDGKDRRKGHTGPCITFVLPNNWKTVVHIGQGDTNKGKQSKSYVSPQGKKCRSLKQVERYLESMQSEKIHKTGKKTVKKRTSNTHASGKSRGGKKRKRKRK